MRIQLLVIAFLLLLSASVFAQNMPPCSSDILHEKAMRTDPAYRARHEFLENQILEKTQATAGRGAGAAAMYTLPVVVHIVHQNGAENISDALVLAGMQHLNESFANTGYYDANNGVVTPIQFCLARQKPDGSPTNGIDRIQNALTNMTMETQDVDLKNLSRWDPTRYVNIWLVREITSDASGPGVAGYAYFPGSHGSNVDGLVFEARWFGSSPANSCVATHEMGHYLGLYHTFQGGCTNNNCMTDGDRVCDTPPDNSTAAVACNASPNSCMTDTQSGFTTDQNDMFINYMDYGNWTCYNAFSAGQSTRMENALTTTRKSLLESKACLDPCLMPISANFTMSANNVPIGSTVNFSDQTIGSAAWEWDMDGTVFSSAKNSSYTFNSVGTFYITLKVTGTDKNCIEFRKDSVVVFCPIDAQFLASDNPVPVGGTVTFTNTTPQPANTWQWTVGTTPISNSPTTATHQFTSLGDFVVQLKAVGSDTACVSYFKDTITVYCSVSADFDIIGSTHLINTNIPLLSTATNWTTLDWTVNGVSSSTADFWDFNSPTAGFFTVCLTASNGYCSASACKPLEILTSLPCPTPPCIEDCDNETDDDGDGLIDCFDVNDCDCSTVPDCRETELPTDFGAKISWTSTSNIVDVVSTPMVANLDPWRDTLPEIIVPYYVNQGNPDRLLIFKGDGSNRAAPYQLMIPQGYNSYPASEPSIADIDRDGRPELIMLCLDRRIRVWTNYTPGGNPVMQLWITSVDLVTDASFRTYFADFDADGIPEIYAGHEVFRFDFSVPAAPALRFAARGPSTGPIGELNAIFGTGQTSSVAADLLTPGDCGGDPDCEGLEIAAGWAIYSVDLTTADGDPVQIKLQKNARTLTGQQFQDGYTAIADLDLNGIQEVIVSGQRGTKRGVYAWNKSGFWTFFPNTQNAGDYSTGIPAVANVFDDRKAGYATDFPEIITTSSYNLTCFNLHAAQANPTQPYWWNLPTSDYSGYTGVTTFDFDGDRIQEIVYRDERDLRIMYGGAAPFPPGVDAVRNWTKIPAYSITADEYPVVADVDADGQADIIFTANPDSGTFNRPYIGRLYVLRANEPAHGPWLSARRLWNQYAYHVVNVNDDLSIPKVPQPGHLEMPGLGSGKRPFNAFLFQRPNYDQNFEPYLPTSDATIEVVNARCIGQNFSLDIRVCNIGSAVLGKQTPITFYTGGDPFTKAATKIGTYSANPQPVAKDSCYTFKLTMPAASGTIYAVINDYGIYATPLPADTAFGVAECDYFNNLDTFSLRTPAKPLNLGPDILGCVTGTYTFNAGSGYDTYRWQDGSTDSTFTAFAPGKYWVETTDACQNLRVDTVVVRADPATVIDLGPDELFCTTTTPKQFDVPGFAEYRWEPSTGLSCATCPNPTASISASITYTLVAKTALGCYSLDTVSFVFGDTSLHTLRPKICEGSNFTFAGQQIPAGTSRTFTYPNALGCDSTIVVDVAVLPKSQSNAALAICPGDSIKIFGNWVASAGIYSKKFLNVHGCDSTHTIAVSQFPQPQNTAENRMICPGDSVRIFGNWVKTAGPVSKIFKNANGCDSMHTVAVALFPAPQNTAENRAICPGDSIKIFGKWVKTAGTYPKTFQNTNGCDSTHSVVLAVFPTPQNTLENRAICPGDSTQVFGAWVKSAGTFPRVFANQNGCDSTHTVAVAVFPPPQNTLENRAICPGDSTQVFGAWVKSAGTFNRTFANINGCDSVHTVAVAVFPPPQNTAENRAICPGDSTQIFGSWVKVAGTFSRVFANQNGCDSLHTVTLAVFAAPQNTAESRTICPGDSSQIFGAWVKTAGSYARAFPNVNGCDSTHTVTLNLFPAPQNTAENRAICPGDSTQVFGAWVKSAGTFPRVFANQNGCDSTHTVTVAVFPAPQNTAENRAICPGDSTQVFGAWVKSAGTFNRTFANINGCDSVHSVAVAVFPQPQNTAENRAICPGDSTQIFGAWVKTDGTFSRVFANANGCDSMHTVTVALFAAPQNTAENRAICAGDSSLIFGAWMKTAGSFSRVFPNINGCDSTHTVALAVNPLPAPDLKLVPPGCLETTGSALVQNPQPGQIFGLDPLTLAPTASWPTLLPGIYRLVVRDANGCETVLPFALPEPPPTYSVRDSVRICPGESVQIFGEQVASAGIFSKNFPTAFGCDSLVTVAVAVIPEPPVQLQIAQPTCLDTLGLLTLETTVLGTVFSLDGVNFTTDTAFTKLRPGVHELFIQNAEGCVRTEAFEVFAVERPKLELPGDTLIELGQSVRIVPHIFPEKNYIYHWEPATWLDCSDCRRPLSTPLEHTEYTLIITDDAGCTATDRIKIKVEAPGIYVPNVFTPDSDSDNNVFTIFASQEGVRRVLNLRVFDRWGNQVFENFDFAPNDKSAGWRGNFREEPMNPAVFVWFAEVEYVNGRKVFLKGDVTLVR